MFKDNDNTDTRELDIARIVPVQDREGEPVVSGRALHYFLEVGTQYSKWIERMLEYGFTEGVDHVVTFDDVPSEAGGRAYRRADHLLSLDMAKELAMIQRTARGKQARQYFIAVEKRARSLAPAQVDPTTPVGMRLVLEAAAAALAELEVAKPKADAWDELVSAEGDYEVADAAKILARAGVKTGRQRLFRALEQQMDWIYRDSRGKWKARQEAVDAGYLAEKPQAHHHPRTGELVLDAPQVRVTVRGIERLRVRLGALTLAVA